MANQISPELLAQLYYQESSDPFLTLITMSDPSFGEVLLVNNTKNIVSRGKTFLAYPFKITLPADDGESARVVKIEMDNTSLEMIDEIRSTTKPIALKIEMILASRPDEVQLDLEELVIRNISYTKSTITATVAMDGFLQLGMDSEKYTPTLYPGLF